MRSHMLKYHVAVPLAVFAVLVLVGAPLASAVSIGITAGCVSMVVMTITGGHHRHHRHQTTSDQATMHPAEPR